MNAAGAVGAGSAVPAIAVASNPGVDSCGEPVNAGKEKNPSKEIPAGEKTSNAGPSVNAREDAAVRIDGLHQPHCFFPIHLRKTQRGLRVVKVEKFDVLMAIESAGASHAASA